MKKSTNKKAGKNVTPAPATAKTQPEPVMPPKSPNPYVWPFQPGSHLPFSAKSITSNTPGQHAKFLHDALQLHFNNLAKTDFERIAVRKLFKFGPPTLLLDAKTSLFLFHYYYLPGFALTLIEHHLKNKTDAPLWLATPANYALAASRAYGEMVLSSHSESESGGKHIKGQANNKLSDLQLRLPKFERLNRSPEFWIRRLAEYRIAAGKSFSHYMGRQCPDIIDLPLPAQQQAALWGALSYISDLPTFDGVDGDIFRAVNKSGAADIFCKNASNPIRRSAASLKIRIKDPASLMTKLAGRQNEVCKYFFNMLSPKTQMKVVRYNPDAWLTASESANDDLLRELEQIVDGKSIYSTQLFPAHKLPLSIRKFIKENTGGAGRRRLNVLLLQHAFPNEISKDDELETWLIEIWPIVTEYHWRKSELFEVATLKFKADSGPLADAKELRKLCHKLGLQFSEEGKRKGPQRPIPMAPLAVFIKGIGENPDAWIKGSQ